MYLGHMLVVNVGRITKILYSTIKAFIDPETVQKITLLSSGEKQKIQDLVNSQELQ